MEIAVAGTTSLVTFTLPGIPDSVHMARVCVRAALRHYELGDYGGDVEMVTSELLGNAIRHANARTVDLELMRMEGSDAVVVVVTDPSPHLPVMRDPSEFAVSMDAAYALSKLCPLGGDGNSATQAKPCSRSSPRRVDPVEAISDLPMLNDIDADYSPQYVKLARIIRSKIQSGEYNRMDAITGPKLADAYGVSTRVAYATLAMLAANRYVSRVRDLGPYRVTWDKWGQVRA